MSLDSTLNGKMIKAIAFYCSLTPPGVSFLMFFFFSLLSQQDLSECAGFGDACGSLDEWNEQIHETTPKRREWRGVGRSEIKSRR